MTYFQAYTIPDLLETLALSGAPGGKAVPTPVQVSGRMRSFQTVAALLFAALVGAGAWSIHQGVQQPEARLRKNTEPGISLSGFMHNGSAEPRNGQTDNLVTAVMASGGGNCASH